MSDGPGGPGGALRGGRQGQASGASDLAGFGVAASGGEMAAAGLSLSVGIAAAPGTATAGTAGGVAVGGQASLVHAIDAPLLPSQAHAETLGGTVAVAVPAMPTAWWPTHPVSGDNDIHASETHAALVAAGADPLGTANGGAASLSSGAPDTAAPASPAHAHGSGTAPDLLQPPLAPSLSDNIETIRTSAAELAEAIGSLANAIHPVGAGVDTTLDGARSDLAAIAESVTANVAALTNAQAAVLAPLASQTEASVVALGDTIDASLSLAGGTLGDSTAGLGDIVSGGLGTLGETGISIAGDGAALDGVLSGGDPAGGLATLHDLLSAETAFELTDPATGALVFASLTAPLAASGADAADGLDGLAGGGGDGLLDDALDGALDGAGLTGTASLLGNDTHDHDQGLGHTLGLFDHG